MSRPATMDGPARAVRGLYESDYFAWVQEQVDHLRARRLDAIDFENIAEELGDLGKSEIDKIRSALAVLLMHMLKWDYQPERMTRSWDNSIAEQRRRYHQILGENPGLKSRLDEILRQAYADSRSRASPDTDLPRSHFPDVCPYTWERILERPFEYEAR